MRRAARLGLALLVLAACSQSAPPHGWTMVAQVKVGQTPGPVVLGGRWAFVANMGEGTVSEIDRATGRLLATITIADPHVLRTQGCAPDSVHAYYSGSWGWRACDTPYAIAWDGTGLWALDNGNRMLWKLDPSRRAVTDRVSLPGNGWSIAIWDGVAFVSGFADNHALYIANLKTHDVTTVDDLDTGPAMLVADATALWVNCVRAGIGHLDRIDPTSGAVTGRFPLEWWSTAIVADQGAIYVRGTFGGDISRVDPTSGSMVWSQPGPGFIGRQGIDQLGPAPNGIWMSGPTTARVDLATGVVIDTIRTPSATVAAADGEVWMVELNGAVAKFQLK